MRAFRNTRSDFPMEKTAIQSNTPFNVKKNISLRDLETNAK